MSAPSGDYASGGSASSSSPSVLADVPSWVLMQELKRRGDLRIAPATEAGFTKGETLRRPDEGYCVDSRGLPLYQVTFDGEEVPT